MTEATKGFEALGGLPPGLAGLLQGAGQTARARPVEQWNPPYCGEIEMRIAADGAWLYRGSPIGREALVRLFASILRREPDGRHVLVTPVESVGIEVEDAPFLAVELALEGGGAERVVNFRTNVGDVVAAGPDRPLRFSIEAETGGLKPYVLVRHGLEALVTRALVHDLVELAGAEKGIRSGGAFFPFPETGLGFEA